MKENIKAPHHWPLCGEFAGNGPVTRKMLPFDDVIMHMNEPSSNEHRVTHWSADFRGVAFDKALSVNDADTALCWTVVTPLLLRWGYHNIVISYVQCGTDITRSIFLQMFSWFPRSGIWQRFECKWCRHSFVLKCGNSTAVAVGLPQYCDKLRTVRYRYNAVDFPPNVHKRHPIAHLWFVF